MNVVKAIETIYDDIIRHIELIEERYTIKQHHIQLITTADDFDIDEFESFFHDLAKLSPLTKKIENSIFLFLLYKVTRDNTILTINTSTQKIEFATKVIFILYYKQWVTQLYRYFPTGIDPLFVSSAKQLLKGNSIIKQKRNFFDVIDYYAVNNVKPYTNKIKTTSNLKTAQTALSSILSDIRNKMNQLVKGFAGAYMKAYKKYKEGETIETGPSPSEYYDKIEMFIDRFINSDDDDKQIVANEISKKMAISPDFIIYLYDYIDEVKQTTVEAISLMFSINDDRHILRIFSINPKFKPYREELDKWIAEKMYDNLNLIERFKKLSPASKRKVMYAYLLGLFAYCRYQSKLS